MTERQAGPPCGASGGVSALLEDWVTIWHSELAALVTDREVQDALLRMIDAWAAQARLSAQAIGAGLDAAARAAGPAAPAGAAAPAAAPDERDAVIAGLIARVEELERRLGRPGPV